MASSPPLAVGILTLVPGYFESPLGTSILGKALERGLVEVEVADIREHAEGRHRVCDDTPYGGGAGMVMRVDPVVRAMEAMESRWLERGWGRPYRVALTPAGRPFSQGLARELVARGRVALVCGRYEGFDERVMGHVDLEVSLGDFVLIGGEVAALAILSTMARLVPGVLGNAESVEEESFGGGLLEYPHFTRPAVFRGVGVPSVLISGDHARIARWRRGQALRRTRLRRPDLLSGVELDEGDLQLMDDAVDWRREVETLPGSDLSPDAEDSESMTSEGVDDEGDRTD